MKSCRISGVCQDLLYGTAFVPALAGMLKKKGKAHPAEILENETFSKRHAAATAKRDVENSEAKAAVKEASDEVSEEEETEVDKILNGKLSAVPNQYSRNSPEFFAATASNLLSIYVSLKAETPTAAGIQKIVEESALGATVRGIGRSKTYENLTDYFWLYGLALSHLPC